MSKTFTFYLAGGLFSAGERVHNFRLEAALKSLGHRVIQPQERALEFISPEGIPDLEAASKDCYGQCSNKENVFLGNLDGPDADSGTAVEFGIAHSHGLTTILYRTDFRTHLPTEVGVNGMFKLASAFVYLPATFTRQEEIFDFYKALASRIVSEVLAL